MVKISVSGRWLAVSLTLLAGVADRAGAEISDAERDFFETRIRPVLAEQCYRCHSHEAKKLKAGLYLDSLAGTLAGGESGPALVPGDTGASLIVEALGYANPDLQMPPKSKLDDAEIADFRKWVAMGAPWPGSDGAVEAAAKAKDGEFDLWERRSAHWAWQPVVDPPVPVVVRSDWPVGEIDRFVLAKMEANGLAPGGEADRRTLIRRLSFDLTGLPPEVAMVESFVADPAENAYERVVDALLASPHFGERWARHWMDLVRYAEACGHEFDYPIPHAFRYRDYLIRALNADVSYRQLVAEHIAGDLLPQPRMNPDDDFNESVIGTGFWHLGEANHAPTDVRGDEVGRLDNQIDVMSKAFLGVTVACARCHDHKFDAISTKDYYAMAGYLQSSRRREAMLDPHGHIAAGAEKLRAMKAEGDALLAKENPRATLIGGEGVECFADFEDGSFDGWFVDGEAFGRRPAKAGEWDSSAGGAVRLSSGMAHSGLLSPKLEGTLRSPTFAIPEGKIYLRVKAMGPGIQMRVIVDSYMMHTYSALLFNGMVHANVDTKGEWGWVTMERDLAKYVGHNAYLEITDDGEGSVAVDGVWFSKGGPPAITESGEDAPVEDAARLAVISEKMAEISKSIPRPMRVQAMADGSAEDDHVLPRGNHKRPGEVVPRHFLEALGGLESKAPETGSGRLELARQMVDPKNPLAARVAVNRLWHHLFGRGLVATTDDFGVLGQRPTHPELLDHLATEFMADGWSTKKAIRKMVLSKTYRLSSVGEPGADTMDPDNLWLHRANVRRLEGEAIRDAMLSVSGRLDPAIGGDSVPVFVTSFMTGRGRPGSGPLDGGGRRSIYTRVLRNFLSPMMLAFDMPIPFSAMGRRSVSNVPAQSLILMNDPFVIGQAELWARKTLDAPGRAEDRIRRMYLEAFSREPKTEEVSRALAYLETDGRMDDPAAWGDYAHVLLNTKEFLFLR
jgi:hypothetical protein